MRLQLRSITWKDRKPSRMIRGCLRSDDETRRCMVDGLWSSRPHNQGSWPFHSSQSQNQEPAPALRELAVLRKLFKCGRESRAENKYSLKTNMWFTTQQRPHGRSQKPESRWDSPTENHAGCSLRCSCAQGPRLALPQVLCRRCSSLPCPPSTLSTFLQILGQPSPSGSFPWPQEPLPLSLAWPHAPAQATFPA